MEDLFFGQKETGAERVAMATALRPSFCFFCDGQLRCQVSLLKIFLEILFFQHFTIFRACAHGGGGPQVGGVTNLSIQSISLFFLTAST